MCWTIHSPLFFREIVVADHPVGGENLHVNGVAGVTSVVPCAIPTFTGILYSPRPVELNDRYTRNHGKIRD